MPVSRFVAPTHDDDCGADVIHLHQYHPQGCVVMFGFYGDTLRYATGHVWADYPLNGFRSNPGAVFLCLNTRYV